ncbi:hypothetical protein [Dankookia sp. P2]|uniref:hypothetical protein n=1 Tax=Dankookia sp. P2 TaxID=3423955 RepID=UPI003D665F8F
MIDLYAAYGSNLWHAQMQLRCPGAAVDSAVLLPGWRLTVRNSPWSSPTRRPAARSASGG